jgi:arylsulfatase A-like enzyme
MEAFQMERMNRRVFVHAAGLSIALCWALMGAAAAAPDQPPNIVVIFLDDSGWSDFEPFGSPSYTTPNVEKLAKEGRRFDNFYVPQAICSASRAALLTGCYPGRTKVFGAHGPRQRGLSPEFATVAEVLKTQGYTTGVFGKWHVGDQPDTRPPARGFDESSGLMYSNDMWDFGRSPDAGGRYAKLPLQFWKDGQVTIENITSEHQTMLTTWYTEHAVDFIQRNKDEPFFLYVPHTMPHVPLYCSDKFLGKSGAGIYGDVMMEIDWSVGEITKALKVSGVEDNTLVIFTSDNGPWLTFGDHAGKTPWREGKQTSFDGGLRNACVMKFSGSLDAGTTSAHMISSLDFLPTFAYLAGAELPGNPVDGKNVWSLITGETGAKNPHDYYPFSWGSQFQGVISGDGRWKFHLEHEYKSVIKEGKDGRGGKVEIKILEQSLFDLQADPYEKVNVIEQYPKIAAQLEGYTERHKERFFSKSGK